MGHETVNVYTNAELNGATAQIPGEWRIGGKTEVGEVVIGLANPSWAVAVEETWHEAIEYLLGKAGCRLQSDLLITNDSSNCLFVFNHTQFTQLMAAAAEFHCTIVNHLHKRVIQVRRAKRDALKAAAKVKTPAGESDGKVS